jgi:nicotinate dehydrogenase subunit B
VAGRSQNSTAVPLPLRAQASSRQASYAQLIGGRNFNAPMKWNNAIGNGMNVEGQAQPKKHSEHRIVGQGVKRADIADKVTGKEHFTAHVRPANDGCRDAHDKL